MLRRKLKTYLMLTLCLWLTPTVLLANNFDYHVLNAGINLGWAEAAVELVGVSPATTPYLTAALANTSAHLTEAQTIVTGGYWEKIMLPSVIPEIAGFIPTTAEYTQDQQVAYIRTIKGRINAKLAQYLEAGRLVSGPACASQLLQVGYFFGRAHIGAFMDEDAYSGAAFGSLNTAIRGGLDVSSRIDCDFSTAGVWAALPFIQPITLIDYTASLYPMQVLVWELGDFIPPPPPPSPPSMPPLPTEPADIDDVVDTGETNRSGPDITGSWEDGNIIVSREGSKFVARGYNYSRWQMNQGARNGQVVLEINIDSHRGGIAGQSVWTGRLKGGNGWLSCETTYGYSVGYRTYTLSTRFGERISDTWLWKKSN